MAGPQDRLLGAWFVAPDGSIVKTCDLSTTFHLVNYRDGEDIKHWPELLATTLSMRNGRFPFGWLEEAQYMSNHHNMDVVTLWRYGWQHATPDEQKQIRDAIRDMMDFCLKQSLQPDGSFKAPEEDTLSSAFYFGVGFLREIGYWSKSKRFWTEQSFPESKEIRRRILNRINALKLDDSEASWTKLILQFEND